MMRYRELLRKGTELLAEAGIEEAGPDAWLLFSFAMGIDRSWYYLHMEEAAGKKGAGLPGADTQEAQPVCPVQYITGEQVFMGLRFRVNESVLIPRQDTEVLVEECLKRLRPGMRVLDMCTGSGCILISLLRFQEAQGLTGVPAESEPLMGTGADISRGALETARQNAEENGVRASFVESDLFENIEGTYDMIVSNPPYIASGEIETLMPEVRQFEPRLALDGAGTACFSIGRSSGRQRPI